MSSPKDNLRSPRPTLDLPAARKRLVNNERLLQELARFFIEDAPGLLEKLRRTIEKGDPQRAAQAAHSLKGLAANFGAQPTEALATEVESAARKGGIDRAAQLQPELKRQFTAVCEILRREILKTTED